MRKQIGFIAACLVAAACGGGGGSKANPAASKTFAYGSTPQAAPPGSADAAAAALSSAAVFETSPNADSAMDVQAGLFEAADVALGSSPIGLAPASRALPLVRAARTSALTGVPGQGFENPACATVASGVVTFRGCKRSEASTDGSTMTMTLDGTVAGAPGSAVWDLDMVVDMSSPELTMQLRYADLGNLAVTATTAKAHQEASIAVSFRSGAQSATIAFAQSADLDTTIAPATCSTKIVAGTFEAKRVWTAVPAEVRDDPEFRDRGVKLVWTGCGQAQAFFSAQ